MQFHGTADRYTLNGATGVATLYSNATTSTTNPAVTLRSVGTNGGQVAAFTFDLARSVIATRQGNPAWAGQDRDGVDAEPVQRPVLRRQPATDWVNLAKVAHPAGRRAAAAARQPDRRDERRDRLPLPRFWYFPGSHKAVVVATGDDHATGGTRGPLQHLRRGQPGGLLGRPVGVPALHVVRLPEHAADQHPGGVASTRQGFEVGLHPQNGCANFTSLPVAPGHATPTQLGHVARGVPSRARRRRPAASTASSGATGSRRPRPSWQRDPARHQLLLLARLVDRRPAGLHDRLGHADAVHRHRRLDDRRLPGQHQMTDESGQSYPFTPEHPARPGARQPGLLRRLHRQHAHRQRPRPSRTPRCWPRPRRAACPVIAARQLLTWTDGRNGSSFSGISWSGSTLSFTVGIGVGATGLTAMLPTTGPGGTHAHRRDPRRHRRARSPR